MVLRSRSQLGQRPLPEVAREFIQAANYRAELERLYPTPEQALSKYAAVEDLVNALGSYSARQEAPTLGGCIV